MMTLIEQLSKGEIYVKNDCTPEEMLSILELAFPQSDCLSIKSINNFVFYKPKKIAVGSEHGGTNDWVQYYNR